MKYNVICGSTERQQAESSWRRHGITNATVKKYNKLLELQNSVCAICSKIPINNRRLCLDHNHKTGEIRGLLCNLCNYRANLIERFFLDREELARTLIYLDRDCSTLFTEADELPNVPRPYVAERRNKIAEFAIDLQCNNPDIPLKAVIAETAKEFNKHPTTIRRALGILT